MQTVSQFKTRAQRLRTHLKENGVAITTALALECQAVQEGERNWNTLRAQAAPTPRKKTSRKTMSVWGPHHGFEHLGRYIGGELPEPLTAGLISEINQIREAIARYDGDVFRLFEVTKVFCSNPACLCQRNEDRSSPTAEEILSDGYHCRWCEHRQRLLHDAMLPAMLKTLEGFLRVRKGLSRSGPILGYVDLKLNSRSPQQLKLGSSPIEEACRLTGNAGALQISLALNEFELHEMYPAELPFGYYADSATVTAVLNNLGVGSNQAYNLGWLSYAHKHGYEDVLRGQRPMTCLVTTYLQHPNEGLTSVWGYRPKAVRSPPGRPGSEMYLVSDCYPKNHVYLDHLIDDRPLVLVTGFLHAISLRLAGVNAVAVPSLQEMSSEAVEVVTRGREQVLISTYAKDPATVEWLETAWGFSGIKMMPSMESYDGASGFQAERFVSDFVAALQCE